MEIAKITNEHCVIHICNDAIEIENENEVWKRFSKLAYKLCMEGVNTNED